MREILLIEDNLFLRRALEDFLISQGYKIHAADTRDEVSRELLETRALLAIIMDYIGPGMQSARQFLAQLRRSELQAETPVIVITAFSHLPEKLDIQGLLRKPFDLTTIPQLLRQFTGPTRHANG